MNGTTYIIVRVCRYIYRTSVVPKTKCCSVLVGEVFGELARKRNPIMYNIYNWSRLLVAIRYSLRRIWLRIMDKIQLNQLQKYKCLFIRLLNVFLHSTLSIPICSKGLNWKRTYKSLKKYHFNKLFDSVLLMLASILLTHIRRYNMHVDSFSDFHLKVLLINHIDIIILEYNIWFVFALRVYYVWNNRENLYGIQKRY